MTNQQLYQRPQRLGIIGKDGLVARLDQWRVRQMPLKSRSQAIARLIEKGMGKEEPD